MWGQALLIKLFSYSAMARSLVIIINNYNQVNGAGNAKAANGANGNS
jgi:hypothetical protein